MMMLVNATLKVRIPDCPGPERVMSVVAADPQMVVKVVQETFLKKYKYKYKYRSRQIQMHVLNSLWQLIICEKIQIQIQKKTNTDDRLKLTSHFDS